MRNTIVGLGLAPVRFSPGIGRISGQVQSGVFERAKRNFRSGTSYEIKPVFDCTSRSSFRSIPTGRNYTRNHVLQKLDTPKFYEWMSSSWTLDGCSRRTCWRPAWFSVRWTSNVSNATSSLESPTPSSCIIESGYKTSNPNQTSLEKSSLPWNRFLDLRRKRRRFGLVGSFVFGLGFSAFGVSAILTRDLEAVLAQQLALDPMIVMGLSALALAATGWLLGPFVGNSVFLLLYKKNAPEMAAKEKEFFARIKKHRADPSSSSVQNPIPDYYGEKIGSVTGYRRWLEDQRAFRRKRAIG